MGGNNARINTKFGTHMQLKICNKVRYLITMATILVLSNGHFTLATGGNNARINSKFGTHMQLKVCNTLRYLITMATMSVLSNGRFPLATGGK